jgi:hypothetical protein
MLEIHPGDTVQMRKPHPCGSDTWEVTRVGTDIGLRCLGCNRRIMLTRSVFNKRAKKVLTKSPLSKYLSQDEISEPSDPSL